MIQNVQTDMGDEKEARDTAESVKGYTQQIALSEKRFVNQSYVNVSMGLNQPRNVNTSSVNVNMNPKAPVNQSIVDVNLNNPNPAPPVN